MDESAETAKEFWAEKLGDNWIASGALNTGIDFVSGIGSGFMRTGCGMGRFSSQPTWENAPSAFLDAVAVAGVGVEAVSVAGKAGTIIRSSEALHTTYKLQTQLGSVIRTGRTGRYWIFRKVEHAIRFPDLEFVIDRQSIDADAIRGREQIINDLYEPIMNKRNPINPNHRLRDDYLREGAKL